MINGHWQQWVDELRQHWQDALAITVAAKHHLLVAAMTIKDAFPLPELIRLGVVAIVTALLTSQVTIARLDERLISALKEREILVKKRDEQVRKLEERDYRIEEKLNVIAVELAALKARVK